MREETIEEFLARGGRISKSSKVLGEKTTVSANYKAGHGKLRMGKNGSGKTSLCEVRSSNPMSSGSYGRPWINKF